MICKFIFYNLYSLNIYILSMFQSNKKFSNIKNISQEKSNKLSAFRAHNSQDDPENQYISGKPYEPYQ